MDRGKGRVVIRGNSLQLDFIYQGQRLRPTLVGLSADKKAHQQRAREILTRIQADMILGQFCLHDYFPNHPKAKRSRRGADISIHECLDTWLESTRRHIEMSTFKTYKSAIDVHLIPGFGKYSLTELTANDVREWINHCPRENKTINNILTPLKSMYQQLFEDGIIKENPLSRISILPAHKKEADPFDQEEVARILASCHGPLHNLFKFAFSTGLRTGELIGLRWQYVDLQKGIVHVRHTRTNVGDKNRPKTSAGIRNIELLPTARQALESQQSYTKDAEHVFNNPVTDRPWKNADRIHRFWRRILKKAEVRYRKPYTTRHTFASLTLSAGVNPMWVARQMGHSDWGMIRTTYGRWIPEVDKSIEEKIQGVFPGTNPIKP